MDFYSVIMDFFWVSVILFVAKIIREHVKILQNFFIPVSLIAGFIAWVVGPYGLKIVPLTSLCGDYAGALITVLFATIGLQGLGIKKGEGKKRAKDIAGYCVYRQINWAVQFSVPMILSILLLSRLHTGGDLHPAFGWLIPSPSLAVPAQPLRPARCWISMDSLILLDWVSQRLPTACFWG